MLKIKNIRSADCVVGGFRYATGARVIGSLLLGLYDDDGLLRKTGRRLARVRQRQVGLQYREPLSRNHLRLGALPFVAKWQRDVAQSAVAVNVGQTVGPFLVSRFLDG